MEKLTVSAAPHIKSGNSITKVMLAVILALLPTTVVGCVYFGINAVLVVVTGIVTAVICEWAYQKIMHHKVKIKDLSAVVTGLLVALNLTATTPLWIVALASAIAIIIAKQLFGGLGYNFANPALVGRIVVTLCFTGETSNYLLPFEKAVDASASASVDAVSGATLLPMINAGEELPEFWRVFLGLQGGTIGEVCSLALIVGGICLIATKTISKEIPISYIATTFVLTLLLGHNPVYSIFSGGLMLGAIFMATDYVTSPMTKRGKIIFGIGCGVITALIRIYGSNPEGVSYAILFMNVLTPLINSATMKKSKFAYHGGKKEAKK